MAGAFRAVVVPSPTFEAARDLARARAGQARSDALPAPALEVAAASRARVGPQYVDEGAPGVALGADVRADQHRARVRRQPRRLRRADRATRRARRAALVDRAGPGVSGRASAGGARSAGSTRSRL